MQQALGRPEQGKLKCLGGVLPSTVGKNLRSREATKKEAPRFSVGHLKVGRQERQGVPLTPATDLQTVCLGRLVGLLVLREGIRRHFRVGRRHPRVDITDRAQVRQATRELPQPSLHNMNSTAGGGRYYALLLATVCLDEALEVGKQRA